MKLPALYRRHYVVLPTFSGLLLMLAISALLIYLFVQNVAHYLAVNEPVGAEYLIVEGWLGKKELEQVHEVYKTGGYQRVIVTGGPITNGFNEHYSSFAERATEYLLSTGFTRQNIITVPSPYSAQDRTFLSAVLVREWFSDQAINVDSLDIFSGDVHSRRTRDLYQIAFGEAVKTGIYSSKPDRFELGRWWESSDSVASVAKELIGLMSIMCCFDPGKKGSHQEKWGIYN